MLCNLNVLHMYSLHMLVAVKLFMAIIAMNLFMAIITCTT
jgi:nitrogen fixation protein FixH